MESTTLDPIREVLKSWEDRNRWDFARLFCVECAKRSLRLITLETRRLGEADHVSWLRETLKNILLLSGEPPETIAHHLLFREYSNYAHALAHDPEWPELNFTALVFLGACELNPFAASRKTLVAMQGSYEALGGQEGLDALSGWLVRVIVKIPVECSNLP